MAVKKLTKPLYNLLIKQTNGSMKIQLVTVLSIVLGVMLPAQAQKRSYTDAAKVAEEFFKQQAIL